MPSRRHEPPAEQSSEQIEPIIIPRSDHSISRKDIDREALKVMHRLRDEGFSAYLVGGAVRDLYLGKTPKDFDISTNAHPGQLRKIFRNSRIIGRRFRLVQVFFGGGKIVEVSTLRCRSEYDDNEGDEVLAANNSFGTEQEDAFRRDLTINALFYEIENLSIIDYTGGVADLNNRIVRIVGDPDRRIVRDPVRMMRAIRHAARSGFTIEENTWGAITRHIASLRLCPDSRIRDEIFKDLHGRASAPWAQLAVKSGIFFELFPCYAGLLDQTGENAGDPDRLLYGAFAVIDRLHTEGGILSDEILLAASLLSWAQARFSLCDQERKGSEAASFLKKLRATIDNELAHLNIKRASREAIAGLLGNLPVFILHAKEGAWPKWLRRKSYFDEGLLLFQIYREALGGDAVVAVQASVQIEASETAGTFHRATKRESRSNRSSSRAPAFSQRKGGVFGLKNR